MTPPLSALLRAGLLTALVDGLFSSVLSVAFYESTVMRLFQGVASTLVGPAAFEGGMPMAVLGILISPAVFGSYPEPLPFRYAGAAMCSIFGLGLIALLFLPETKDKPLPE